MNIMGSFKYRYFPRLKLILVIIIFTRDVSSISDGFKEFEAEWLSCQTNFSSATSINNFHLECSVDMAYILHGTAQCIRFTENSLIVESSPSVLNNSLKCISNKPIFSNIQFDYGIPLKPLLKFSWKRHFTDYNDPLSYSYQVTATPPLNSLSSIGITSVRYHFFNIEDPNEKIQILWHFSKDYEEEDYIPTVSWLGDISTEPVDTLLLLHSEIKANEEMVTIPCVSPKWEYVQLNCFNRSDPDGCSSSIPIDNITLYHDPLTGFILNTTRHNIKGDYYCIYQEGDDGRYYVPQAFRLSDHANFTSSSQIAYFGSASELITPPFVHVFYEHPDDGPYPHFTIFSEKLSTRFELECSSTFLNVTIIGQSPYGELLDLNVTKWERDKPVKTFVAKTTTPPDLLGYWYYFCSPTNVTEMLSSWLIYYNEQPDDFQSLPHLELSYDDTYQSLNCFTELKRYSIDKISVELRHVDCENIFMCRELAKCLHDTNYGRAWKNCRKGFGLGTVCETSSTWNISDEIAPVLAGPCVSVKPFSKGLAFCIAQPMDRTLQSLYLRGFDNKFYIGDIHPPIDAIIKITIENSEETAMWAIPSYYLLQCEAHSFYFEDGLQWFFVYADGSSRMISNENVENLVDQHVPDASNPISTVKIFFNDTSIVGIKCSAPALSIRNNTSHCEWQNKTLEIELKKAIAPIFETKPGNIKEIRIGDENQGPKCEVKGFPQPIIKWFKNGQLLTNTKEDVTKRASGEYFIENFLLFPIYTQSDAGDYICVATNMLESVEQVFTVRTEETKNKEKTLFIIVPVVSVCIVLAISTLLLVSYRMKIQRVRKQEMKEILEILKGQKRKSSSASTSSNVESMNPLKFPYVAKYELKKHSLYIDYSKILGTGEFGAVFQGRLSNIDNDVAFKTVNSNDNLIHLKSLTSELKILMYIGKHSNIIELLGAYTQEIEKDCRLLNPDDKMCNSIQRGYVRAGEINYSPNHSLKTLLKWSAEIADAMIFLGTKNVIHSDLAARNVLLTVDFVAKITDFGLSRKMYSSFEYVKKGQNDPLPWRWLAIESLQNLTFSPESDVWSYGITLWEMFSFGDMPYPGIDNPANLISQLLETEINPNPRPTFASPHLYDVMVKCWNLIPERRPSFAELKDLFQDTVQSFN